MKTTSNPKPTTPSTAPARRFLDPFEEWRDHANQWDVAALRGVAQTQRTRPTPPQSQDKKGNATSHTV